MKVLREGDDRAQNAAAAMEASNAMLEVVVYPVMACPGGRRRYSRRRVVITVESLWQRRQRLHSDAVLLDAPPMGLANWSRCFRSSTVATQNLIGDGGEANATRVDGGRSERVEGLEREGDGDGARGTAQNALDDLLNMVAIGPPSGVDGDGGLSRCKGARTP